MTWFSFHSWLNVFFELGLSEPTWCAHFALGVMSMSIKMDTGKSLVILKLPPLWLVIENKFQSPILWRSKNFDYHFFSVKMSLSFWWKNISRQKNNYGNSNISPCKTIIFKKKISKRNQFFSRCHNFINNPKFP
jgi:hypothetical protein